MRHTCFTRSIASLTKQQRITLQPAITQLALSNSKNAALPCRRAPARPFAASAQPATREDQYHRPAGSEAPSTEQALPESLKNRPKQVPVLVDAQYVLNNLSHIVPIDASWYMPAEQRDAYKEFLQKRIVGAKFFDLDAIADQTTMLPHMLPTPAEFELAMHELGIRNSDHLVIYDTAGIFSSPRAYFTFRVFGHERVSILNGGLPAYLALPDPPLAHGTPSLYPHKHYTASWHPEYVATLDLIRENLKSQEYLVLDARNPGRFSGTTPEPRANLRSGHIPRSKNIPFNSLLQTNPLSQRPEFRSPKELQAILAREGVNVDAVNKGEQKIITSCGTGVTAAVIGVALELAGVKNYKLYDGSWTEYGDQKHDHPVETSAAV